MHYIIVLLLATLAMANTETHIIRVPKYFDIPTHESGIQSVDIQTINQTHYYMADYPILDKTTYLQPIKTIEINDSFHDKQHNTILVKLNNYFDNTYDSNDLLFVKLCWPAIYPVSFALDHKFIYTNELGSQENTFDMFLQIDMDWDFKTFDSQYNTISNLKFKLVIEKLANQWIPIPLEVYDIIVYLVDTVILLHQLFQYIKI